MLTVLDLHIVKDKREKGIGIVFVFLVFVKQGIKKKRSAELIALEKGIRAEEFDRILVQNGTHTVLFESFENGFAYGHTPNFLEIKVKSERPLHSEVLNVRLVSHNGETFFAEIVDKA